MRENRIFIENKKMLVVQAVIWGEAWRRGAEK